MRQWSSLRLFKMQFSFGSACGIGTLQRVSGTLRIRPATINPSPCRRSIFSLPKIQMTCLLEVIASMVKTYSFSISFTWSPKKSHTVSTTTSKMMVVWWLEIRLSAESSAATWLVPTPTKKATHANQFNVLLHGTIGGTGSINPTNFRWRLRTRHSTIRSLSYGRWNSSSDFLFYSTVSKSTFHWSSCLTSAKDAVASTCWPSWFQFQLWVLVTCSLSWHTGCYPFSSQSSSALHQCFWQKQCLLVVNAISMAMEKQVWH